jgi:hypothetical protein
MTSPITPRAAGVQEEAAATESLQWAFLPEWNAWWLLFPSGERGFGPFNKTEAVWAGEVHGVPFAAGVKEDQRG